MSALRPTHRVLGVGFGLLIAAALAAATDKAQVIRSHYERAQQALKSNQPAAAAQEFLQILRLDPRNAEAHANLGVIAFTQGDYSNAAHDFRAALRLQPSLWNAQAFLGMCELRLGRGAQAKPLLENSFPHLEDAVLRTQAGLDLVQIHQAAKDLDRAVEVLRVLQRLRPSDPDVLYAAYRTYSDLAARTLATMARAAPQSARMHQILAQTLASQDDFQGAIAQYRKALELDSRLPGIHFELGQMILANSHEERALEEAQKEFEADLAVGPTRAESEYMLGEIWWARSNGEEALKHYSHALELRPDYVDGHVALGKTLMIQGRLDDALQHFQEAARLDPENDVAHYRLAQAYRKLGHSPDADREWALFRKLRDAQAPIRSLYQQIQQRPAGGQTIDPNEPQ